MLEKILRVQGIVKIVALITFPSDEYSNFNSMQFYEKMGYNNARQLETCGYKWGPLYMDKFINLPQGNIQPIKTFDEVRKSFDL